MYQRRKEIERDILSSHGDATRFFVTFLDNHDIKERIRYGTPRTRTSSTTRSRSASAACIRLPGIPCLYYGTEQGSARPRHR